MNYWYRDREYYVHGYYDRDSEPHAVRGPIAGFSESAGRRMCKYLRNSVASYKAIGTLTYPAWTLPDHIADPKRCKRDLDTLCKRISRRFGSEDKFSLFWFLEFTGKGVPHFHFFVNVFIPHAWLARAWADVCDLGDAKHAKAGTSIEQIRKGRRGITAYAAKYAAKQEQKIPPCDGFGRFWGVVGCRETVGRVIRLEALQQAMAGPETKKKIREARDKITQIVSHALSMGLINRKQCPEYTYYIKVDKGFWDILGKMLDELDKLIILARLEHAAAMVGVDNKLPLLYGWGRLDPWAADFSNGI